MVGPKYESLRLARLPVAERRDALAAAADAVAEEYGADSEIDEWQALDGEDLEAAEAG